MDVSGALAGAGRRELAADCISCLGILAGMTGAARRIRCR